MSDRRKTRNGRRQSRKPRPEGSAQRGPGRREPGEITLSFSMHKTVRYTVVAATNTWPITREELLNLFYMGTGTNSARRIIGSIRLRKIVIYGEGAFPTTGSTAIVTSPEIKWLGTGPQSKKAMTSFGGQPQYVSSRPPPRSFAGFWSETGTNEAEVLLEITAGTGNIIDVTVDFIIQNDDPQIASALVTSATATAGIIYYNNLGGAVSTIQPQVGNANYAT